jgi:AcrR family transcriptional regulator
MHPRDPDGPAALGRDPAAASTRRERNAQATQRRLLDAAEQEFADRGFAGARLREIAVTAGVQPALIHHYFADKHGLYRAVLDRALLAQNTGSWAVLASEPDLPALVRGFVDLLVPFYAEHRNLLAILRHEAVSGSSVLAEVTRERALPILRMVEAFLVERQQKGDVRADVPVDEMILACISMVIYPFVDGGMVEVLLPSAGGRDDATLERRKRAITTLVLAAIAAPSAPKRRPIKRR